MSIIGTVAFLVFIVVEKRIAKIPMIPLHLCNRRSTNVLFLQAFAHHLVWQVDLYFLPVYFQDVRGYSPL